MHVFAWLMLILTGLAMFGTLYPFHIVALHVCSNTLLVAALFYASAWVVNRYFEKSSIVEGIAVELVLILIISVLRIVINFNLAQTFKEEHYSNGLFTPLGRVSLLVISTSLLVAVMGLSFQLLRNRLHRERQAKALLQEQQTAQLQLLKSQINPHFLFNALNNIYSLVELRSPDAPKMLLKLSDLLRYVIYEGQKTEIVLSKEVEYIRNFVQLFQMRSEHAANIRFEIDDNFTDKEIEPMILIPLVENCFKHADFDLNPDAWAIFRLESKPELLRFSTQNTFFPHNHQKDAVGGVGLQNIARRLELRYPNRFQFRAEAQDKVFFVQITIHHPSV